MSPLLSILIAASGHLISGHLHVRVDGEGYLRLMREGQPVYAKEADLAIIDGLLGSHGATFLPAIRVSGQLTSIKLDLMGNVGIAGSTLGRLVLALPVVPGEQDSNGFTTFTDRPALTNPGEGTAGVIRFEGNSSQNSVPKSIGPDRTFPGRTGAQAPSTNPLSPAAPHASQRIVSSEGALLEKPTKSTSGKLEVLVHVHTEVGNDPVTLGQVAQLSGPKDLVEKAKSIVIANPPPIGIKRVLDEHTLVTMVRGADIPITRILLVCPNGADVVQKSQTVVLDAITKAAQDAVTAKYGGSIPLVVAQKIQPIVVPVGEITYESSEPEAVGDGYYTTVTIKVGGEVAAVRSVTLCPSKDAPHVRQNDPLTVVMMLGTATVEVSGKAKTGGYVGQRIEVVVENVGAKPTVHIGTLVSPNRVEVQL